VYVCERERERGGVIVGRNKRRAIEVKARREEVDRQPPT
jgi:hypothetical protein